MRKIKTKIYDFCFNFPHACSSCILNYKCDRYHAYEYNGRDICNERKFNNEVNKKMVERTNEVFTEFEGLIEDIVLENTTIDGREIKQYHLIIEATDKTIKGKTGKVHEWIKLSNHVTETSVPKDSTLDLYMQEIENILSDAKSCKSVSEEMNLLKGKKFHFTKKVLGREFEGKKPREMWIPDKVLA